MEKQKQENINKLSPINPQKLLKCGLVDKIINIYPQIGDLSITNSRGAYNQFKNKHKNR